MPSKTIAKHSLRYERVKVKSSGCIIVDVGNKKLCDPRHPTCRFPVDTEKDILAFLDDFFHPKYGLMPGDWMAWLEGGDDPFFYL